MRMTAKAPQNKLEWSILDVEQEEWERQLAELGIAAAANGFPLSPAAAQARREEAHASPSTKSATRPMRYRVRRALPVVALFIVLGVGLVGYSAWRTAQGGISRMEGDVANAVKVETLHENSKGRAPAVHESVLAVEFLEGAAQAAVLVTHTLGAGGVHVQPELRFYVQTAKGWQRSDPVAGFWGPTETLDTAHLHFVYGRRDGTVVAAVAPGVETVYATLLRATGQELAGGSRLTIEIVPEVLPLSLQPGARRIRMTSPALYPAAEQEQTTILGRLLRLVLSQQFMETATQKATVKPQWQPLVHGLGAWMAYSGNLPFAPGEDTAALRRSPLRMPHSAWQLDDLLAAHVGDDAQGRSILALTSIGNPEQQRQQEAAAQQLIGYIAGTYGVVVLPRLRVGFAQYEGWEELAPAVLGVSAAELEEGWHAAMRKAAHLHIFR